MQPPHKVNLSSPEKTVIVQLLKSSAALSVVTKHRELMRFNLKELSTTDEEQVKAARDTKEREKESQAAQANGSTKTAGEEPVVPAEQATVVPDSKESQDQVPDAGAGSTGKANALADQDRAVAHTEREGNDTAEAQPVHNPGDL